MRQSVLFVFFAFISLFSGVSLAADESPWSFAIFGDSRGGLINKDGFNGPIVHELVREMVRQRVDFVAFPGDLVIGSDNERTLERQLTAWREAMGPVYDAGIKVYPLRGNHDDGGNGSPWSRVFSGRYALPENGPAGEKGMTYAVKHKNMLLLGLDHYVEPHRANQQWLDEQLSASDKPHTFVFGHAPAFEAKHEDCLDDHPEARDAFWESLKRAGVRVYACGHDHFFDHAIVDDGDGNPHNDIHQYIVATAGAPLKDWKPPYRGHNGDKTVVQLEHAKQFGYVLVEVLSDSAYRLTWHGRQKAGVYVPSNESTLILRGAESLTAGK